MVIDMSFVERIRELKESDAFWQMAYVAAVTYVTSLAVFTVLFLLTPLLIQSGVSTLVGIATVSYKMVSVFYMCHQLPERSLFLWDMQFPICSRCMGIYLGGCIGGLAAFSLGSLRLPRIFRTKKMLLLMIMPMAVDGVTQTILYARESDNTIRLATGLMFGFGVLYYAVSAVIERNRGNEAVRNDAWRIALAINAMVILMILAAGLYAGGMHVSKDEALSVAAGLDGRIWAERRVYYVPQNALRNVKNDPYLGSYDDVVLKELASVDYRKHGYGVWVVALLDEPAVGNGKYVYMSETPGAYVYIDAVSGRVDRAKSVKGGEEKGKETGAVRADAFTIIVLPDTEKYSDSYPQIFENQTMWIAGNIGRMNIAYVAHEGDIVHDDSDLRQWVNANRSMSLLDGIVPYGLLPGNHDGASPSTNYNTYFPAERYASYVWYGGGYSGNRYNYQTFNALGEDYVVVNLAFCPSANGIKWANRVLQENRERKAIVVTHAYLDLAGGRNPHGCDTQYIWNDLIAPNGNVFLVLSGHVHSEARRNDTLNGRMVHQLLADYQDEPNGGNGWLRILEFIPSEGRISVRTYSPYLQQYQHDVDSEFTLDFNIDAVSEEVDQAKSVKNQEENGAVRADAFTVIVLPDTQHYSDSYPEIFENQTMWIAGNIGRMNIAYVAHEGDIVHDDSDLRQWANANRSMSLLDGIVPYGLLPGNHDGASPSTNYNTYFPAERFASYPWYGGGYSGNRYNYQTFTAAGEDYLVVNLAFCPSANGIKWANGVLQENKDRKAIVVTHAYLDLAGGRSPPSCYTQYIWNDLIAPNGNVFLVLSGHAYGESRRFDTVNGRIVHQLLANYQDDSNGGNGWLRILEFIPSEGRIRVRTYSPYLQDYQQDRDSEFTLDFNATA